VQPGYLRALVAPSAPEDPEPWDAIHADIESKILPGITHWQSPKFMAFFPCNGSYPAMLAEMYSNAFNGAHFNWICSPAVTELETIVLDWLAKMIGLPECYISTSAGPTRGGGVIHGSASEAILTAMVAARDKYLRELTAHIPEGDERDEEICRIRGRMVALGSAMAHSSTKKAAQILGVRFVTVPVKEEDDHFAMRGPALAATIEQLRARGFEPFYLTATFGSTDTCAIDDFSSIASTLAEIAPESKPGSVWVHVDGAYAGSALICPEYHHYSATFSAFHSVNFNPHKWLLVNFDCSTVWVRNSAWFVDALSIKPPYLRNGFSEAGLVTDYRDWQIPLGRRFRSLKLWFVIRSYGVSGLKSHVRRGMALGEKLAELVRSRPDLFEIVTPPKFALVVLRVIAMPEGSRGTSTDPAPLERQNKVTEKLYEAINAEGEIYLTSTILNGKYAIRVCTASSQVTNETHIQRAFNILVEGAEKALNET
jgi:aromatic-L-amino-acid/L-tryptophan decarboxylase